MLRQMVLDFDAPPPDSRAGRLRRLYMREGEPVPDWLRTLETILQLQDDELQQPDPLERRVPVVGDRVEILSKSWLSLGWTAATVIRIDYPRSPIMDVRLEARQAVDSLWVSRADWLRNPNIDKGTLWRWPLGRVLWVVEEGGKRNP